MASFPDQLTHLRISVPASGAPPDQVPADCFPGGGLFQRSSRAHAMSHSPMKLPCWGIRCLQCVCQNRGCRRSLCLRLRRRTSSRRWGSRSVLCQPPLLPVFHPRRDSRHSHGRSTMEHGRRCVVFSVQRGLFPRRLSGPVKCCVVAIAD